MAAIAQPILNLVVVGFHHKKGCQIEYCYPELVPGNPQELPKAWRHLPALALPDGSHNFHSDTVFFHLPDLNLPTQTVYGISCFRQIPLEQVTQRTSDMTRSSVQKSVCVISKEPLFGHFAVKLELVVRHWFKCGDFSSTKLLEDAYKHLNGCPTLVDQLFEGLSVVNLIETWRHKAVLLFKLLLLQKKVVLHGSPAGPVSNCLLTLLSLFPECIQSGLKESANIVLIRPMSPIPLEVANTIPSDKKSEDNNFNFNGQLLENDQQLPLADNKNLNSADDKDLSYETDNINFMVEREKCHSVGEKYKSIRTLSESQSTPSMVRDMSVNGLTNLAASVDYNECGMPLKLFSEGFLCLPYLSLQYMDLLSDPAVKGFLIGASNVLFKQKRQLFDVLVELNDNRIETADFVLRRQLQLSTEDLRFADHLVRHGSLQGDMWIRDQFAGYLLCLLRSCSLPDGCRELDHFNSYFISAFKTTVAYDEWLNETNKDVTDIFTNMPPGHPFAGQLSVQDMKLRLAHTMANTESGRKMTQAVANTSRAVVSTSKVVGGALSQAKGALSVWWSTLTTQSPQAENTPPAESEFEVLEALPNDISSCKISDSKCNDVSLDDGICEDNIILNQSENIKKITIYSPNSIESAEEVDENNEDILYTKCSKFDIKTCDTQTDDMIDINKKCA